MSLLNAATKPDAAEWGWHESSNGLLDLYIPLSLRSWQKHPSDIAGVLVFGRYVARRNRFTAWIRQLTSKSERNLRCLGNRDGLAVERLRSQLLNLAEKVPDAPIDLMPVEASVKSVATLTASLARQVLDATNIPASEALIAGLDLTRLEPQIGEGELWNSVGRALTKVTETLGLQSFAVFSGPRSQYEELTLRTHGGLASVPNRHIGFRSRKEFAELASRPWLSLPTSSGPLAWLNPKDYVAAPAAVALGTEVAGQHLCVLLIGCSSPTRLDESLKTIVYDAVTARLFPYIHEGKLKLEMDYFMEEIGHLVTRAVAAITEGSVRLLPAIEYLRENELQSEEYDLSAWAMEDGAKRLELIANNFNFFRQRRLDLEDIGEISSQLSRVDVSVDVSEVLLSMRAYFEKAIKYSERKIPLFDVSPTAFTVVGSEDVLRVTLLNLFDNALKFSYKNTRLTFEVKYTDDWCVVQMSNVGVGVPREELTEVLRPRRRGSFSDPSKKRGGLGLGLSYCQWAVEGVFGGRITLMSKRADPDAERFEGDGAKTTVRIEFPRPKNGGLEQSE